MTIHCPAGSPDAAIPLQDEPWSFRHYFLILLAAAAVVIGADLLDGTPFARDVDDVLRELQIRRLVDGAAWLDLSLPSVKMPETYILPWSRLVDLPYALIAWGLGPVVGQERSLALAFQLWPPVLAVFYLLTLLGCLRRLVPRLNDLPVTLLLTMPVFAIYSIWEFSPGRIDHHNVQIVLLMLVFYGLLRWDRLGGVIIGAASSLSVAVGLETLPVLAVALGALSLAWLLDGAGSRTVLRSTGSASAIVTLLLMAALIAPAGYLSAVNDSFSAPYAAAMIGFGIIASISTGTHAGTTLRGSRLLFIGAHLLLFVALAWSYPGLLDGPMPMLNGLAKTYWFDRINFEQNLFSLFSSGDMRSVLQYLAVFAVMAAATPAVVRAMLRGEPAFPVLFISTVTAVVMASTSLRFLRIALALVVILLPLAFLYFRAKKGYDTGRRAVVGCLASLALLAVGRMYLFPPERVQYDAFDYVVRGDCGDVDLSALDLRPARIMTSPRLGIEIAHRRRDGISVSTIPFHRASAAMSDMFAVMTGKTAVENRTRLKDFDYLAFCRIPAGLPNQDALPLLGDLQAGRNVAGLQPLPGKGAVMIFRIDHAGLK